MKSPIRFALPVACSSSRSPPAGRPSVSTPPPATPAPPTTDPASRPLAQPPSADHPLPVVVDTDLAGDDIFALLTLLRNDAVDLRGVTIAATGEVHCVPGIRNVRRLLAVFGHTDVPVACGRENPGPNGRWFPPEWRLGADGFYGVELPAVEHETAREESAPELLVRLASDSADPITLLTLGPLSNVADAAALDPAFASHLAGIHAMAGTIDAPGNISYGDTSPADGVEWNVGADPDAMAAVLALDVPITLVGLDATDDVPVPADIVDQLAADHAAAGADIAYEMYARTPFLAGSGNSYWDPLAAITLTDPSVAGWEDVALTMQPSGRDAGRLVRDPSGRPARVAMSADPDAFMPAFLGALRTGAPRAHPFTIAGSMEVRWDGTACTAVDRPKTAGLVEVTLVNTTQRDVALLLGEAAAPKTWADVVTFITHADLADPNLKAPDWIVQVPIDLSASAGTRATAFAPIPAGTVGILCATGTYPDLTFHDGGPITLGG